MLGVSIWQSYSARKVALNVIQGRRPFGPPEPPLMDQYGYPDHEAQKQKEAELGAQTMTRDELAVYDIVKTISFLFFLQSILSFGLGKLGMRTVWREKSICAHRVSRKSCFGLLFVFIFGMILKHEGGELHKIIMRNMGKQNHSSDISSIINKTDSFNLTEPLGRNLQSHHKWEDEPFFGDEPIEDICEALDNDGCESDERCSWCKSAAVASACKSVEVAKSLPQAVFDCDNLDASQEEFAGRHQGHHGKFNKDHHKGGKGGKHGHHEGKDRHGKHGKERKHGMCKHCPMHYGGMIYVITLVMHMCNLRCYFHNLSTWEAKRVEAGEVLSEDDWGCGPWKKKWKKKQEQKRINQTGRVQVSDDSQIDSSSTQMQ